MNKKYVVGKTDSEIGH